MLTFLFLIRSVDMISNLIRFLAFTILTFGLVGCYEFKRPPLPDAVMKPILSTQFGREIAKAREQNNGELAPKGSPMAKLNKNFEDMKNEKVFVLRDDLLISQQKKDKGDNWEITVLMKNSSHLMFCTMMTDSKGELLKTFADKIKVVKKKDGPTESILIDGDVATLQKVVIALVEKLPKLCMAIPFSSSS
jgi:hypothetical protein